MSKILKKLKGWPPAVKKFFKKLGEESVDRESQCHHCPRCFGCPLGDSKRRQQAAESRN